MMDTYFLHDLLFGTNWTSGYVETCAFASNGMYFYSATSVRGYDMIFRMGTAQEAGIDLYRVLLVYADVCC